jgi:uncharacterized protein YyaL (SSP411 family)
MSDPAAPGNRLAAESRPYLRLHRDNPVDWYPWGSEALERARAEDRPIFLSVGYSTCHWCHVMERESFSDPAIGELLGRHFVAIKVDREERPEIDEIYMMATQVLAGQGGWPNSVFLTPELKPYYAGTYFPPEPRHGMPSFTNVVRSLGDAWVNRRADVEQQAAEVAETMRRMLEDRGEPGAEVPSTAAMERTLAGLSARFDEQLGGFSPAPKFPSPSNLFLLQEVAEADSRAAEMLGRTLDEMARGGIYDQLAGGFHRYATDRQWRVPHFEKMLYDNGLLLEVYAREHARTGDSEAARIARGVADFLSAEMTSDEGAFWSAVDADTDGEEGAYYVWTDDELREILGDEEALYFEPLLGFAGPPFFEQRWYVLHYPRPVAEMAAKRRTTPQELLTEIDTARARLLEARDRRPRPPTDEKILTDWNGMAIGGMALAGRSLADEGLVGRAVRAAEWMDANLRSASGTLLHARRPGQEPVSAFLSDYVFLVRGLLALHEVSGEASWLERAVALTEEQDERLAAAEGGYYLAAAAPDLLFRSREIFDGAVPSTNGVAALNLLRLAEITGDPVWRHRAEKLLAAFGPMIEQAPDATRTLALAVQRFHRATSG